MQHSWLLKPDLLASICKHVCPALEHLCGHCCNISASARRYPRPTRGAQEAWESTARNLASETHLCECCRSFLAPPRHDPQLPACPRAANGGAEAEQHRPLQPVPLLRAGRCVLPPLLPRPVHALRCLGIMRLTHVSRGMMISAEAR